MGSGDISQLYFEKISEMCRKYSQSQARSGKGPHDSFSKISKSTSSSGVTREELGNLLENFKTDILGTLSLQLDTLQIKKKKEEQNATLSIFFPRCRKRHPFKRMPLE
jgi:hypothetical protein